MYLEYDWLMPQLCVHHFWITTRKVSPTANEILIVGFWTVWLIMGFGLMLINTIFGRNTFYFSLKLSVFFLMGLSYPHSFVCVMNCICLGKKKSVILWLSPLLYSCKGMDWSTVVYEILLNLSFSLLVVSEEKGWEKKIRKWMRKKQKGFRSETMGWICDT